MMLTTPGSVHIAASAAAMATSAAPSTLGCALEPRLERSGTGGGDCDTRHDGILSARCE